MKTILLLTLIMLFTMPLGAMAQTARQCIRPSAPVAAVMDTVTTVVVLHQGGYERNPIGFANTIMGKGVYFAGTHVFLTQQQREQIDPFASSVWTGAAVNNFMIALGASNPISATLGLVSMVMLVLERCPTPDNNKELTNDTRNN